MKLSGVIDAAASLRGEQSKHHGVSGNVTVHDLTVTVATEKKVKGAVEGARLLEGTINLGGGGGGRLPPLQEVTVRSTFDRFGVEPDPGYYGIGKVIVDTDPNLTAGNIRKGVKMFDVTGTYGNFTSKSDTIIRNGSYNYTPGSYDGLSKVSVTVNVPTETIENVVDANLTSLSVTPSRNSQTFNKQGATGENDIHGYNYVYVAGDSDLVSGNIRKDVTIFGVTGTYEKTDVVEATFQEKTLTPNSFPYYVRPDSGYDGLKKVTLNADSDLKSSNIKSGVNIFGVTGDYTGEGAKTQAKTVTPSSFPSYVYPDSDYDGLSQVRINADSNLISSNIANGKTIFGVRGNYESPMQVGTAISGASDYKLALTEPGALGFSEVFVKGDPNLIGANIKAGVSILGVAGTYAADVLVNPGTAYLTFASADHFTIETANAMRNWNGELYYSTDTIKWSEWRGSPIASAEHNGEHRIYMCGVGNKVLTRPEHGGRWILSGSGIACRGNIETLLDYKTVANGEHPRMAEDCYRYMFLNCASLTQAPSLNAAELTARCYYSMFEGCSGLTKISALPATILADDCCRYMFFGCNSLTQAPALPATTLASRCYYSMFEGCTSLAQIPALPATRLADSCYIYMFYGCSSLKLSTDRNSEYDTPYQIPYDGECQEVGADSLTDMFTETGGTFTGTPSINTTYYTSNEVI